MQRSDFYYDLPPELIAQYPLKQRSASRLLTLSGKTGQLSDSFIRAFPELLEPGDLLVLNDTRVIPARLHGQKSSGGKIEVLVERVLDTQRVLAHVRASKSPKAGAVLEIEGNLKATVEGREEDFFILRFEADQPVVELLEQHGHMPLPPYIERADEQADRMRYQTLYGEKPGAVAAPTAGLHFDEELLAEIDVRGVQTAKVTLHVGAGTFQPVRVDNLAEHKMHAEWIDVPQATVDTINQTRARGGRIIAVGTTVVRSLESAAKEGELTAFSGDTRLFITPGYQFKVVDAMLTNFHLPESTLLMLVAAFAGYDNIMRAYRHAVAERYRFFSYGDAMFLTRQDV